jgi:nicotinate-nucleotide pyrophosphorylase (carboxylating)
VRAARPDLGIEVEVGDSAEIAEAISAGVPRLLLDNMDVEQLQDAVAQVAGRASLEASGGVSLETLRAVAGTGVQFVSMGALTHSAPALDLSMTIQPLSGPQ